MQRIYYEQIILCITYLLLSTACGGMDNQCTVYDMKNRDSMDAAKITRELLGYEGFLSCARFINDSTLITGSGDRKV